MSPGAAADTDLVRACFRQPVSRTPVWFMRQAGRSLPEYRAARGTGSILTAIADAPLAAELTLQPVRRYGVDAAILFSDIVVPVHAIGFGVDVEPGRGPVVAEPFRSEADLPRLRPLEPALDTPHVIESVRLVRRELAGSGVALIGFAGAPFTVASYLIEGGPSRTFTKVKALMHGNPPLWGQLMERLAAMSVAFLRAQIEAGVQAVQLFDSWAGSLSPAEYTRFVLPTTRAVLEGIADLGVPTILFGVGTGELLGLMATTGRPAARRAGQPGPGAVRGRPLAGGGGRHPPGHGRRGGRRHRHRPRLQPGPRRPARGRHRDPGSRGRPRARREPTGMTAPVGVLVMAHGTPSRRQDIAPFYTRIRRGRPPTPEQLAELEGRYAAIGGLSPLTERTVAQVDAVRAALEQRAPGRYVVTYGAKHTEPLIEEGAASLVAAGAPAVIGVAVDDTKHSHLLAERVTDALTSLGASPANGRTPVVFTAHSLPERVRQRGDTYPEQLEESARLVAAAAGISRWQVAWQSAGRTPEPWLGPDIRDVVRRLAAAEGADGADGVVVCPIGFVTDHLEVLYDLDVELAAVAAEVGLPFARTASLNDDPRFIGVLADVVSAAGARRD